MLGSDDVAQMQSDLAVVRGDRSESIVIRRGHGAGLVELPAQVVRLARVVSQGRESESAGASQAEGRAVILGMTNLDIQIGDRFNDGNGTLYEVVFIRPNRSVATMAEARIVE